VWALLRSRSWSPRGEKLAQSGLVPDNDHQVAWLALVVTTRKRQSNDGYDDDPASHYSWGQHRAQPRGGAGRRCAGTWDTHTVLRASVIERVDTGSQMKAIYRCRGCGQSNFEARKTMSPKYRCSRAKPSSTSRSKAPRRSRHSGPSTMPHGWISTVRYGRRASLAL
jgi:hypothetical protein